MGSFYEDYGGVDSLIYSFELFKDIIERGNRKENGVIDDVIDEEVILHFDNVIESTAEIIEESEVQECGLDLKMD